MKTVLLMLLGIVLIGIAVAIRETDSIDAGDSPILSPGQEASLPSRISEDRADSSEPPQAEFNPKPAPSGSQGRLLVFPDGEVLEVNWRERMRPTIQEFGIDNYEILREAALTGDAIASMMLYEMQRNCQSRYESEDELEAAVEQLYQTHTIPIPGQQQPGRLGNPQGVEGMADMMRHIYYLCEKLLAYQGNFEENWLERSANDGWPLAMIELGKQQEDPESARNLYQAAWDAGSAHSLSLLSEIIKETFESGEAPDANVEAFALLHTYTIIETTQHRGRGRIAARWAARLQAKLDEEQKDLLPQELQEALEMSKQMIRSNPNCCYGF